MLATHPSLLVGVLLALAVLLGGCAATPEKRIKKNPEVFAAFPADVQEKVRRGEVDIGFTKDMVLIALGEPDRTYTRRDERGLVEEVWAYHGAYYTRGRWFGGHAGVGFGHRRGHHRFPHHLHGGPTFVEVRHEYERLRLSFEDGEVKSIERISR